MAALSRVSAEARDFLSALLRGCGQVAFCDSRSGGALILVGISLASPFSALGMLYGALVGTTVGRLVKPYRDDGWIWGLAGFNPAIIGLLSGGFLASGELHPAWLMPMFALCMLADVAVQRILRAPKLPALSAAAVITAYFVSLWLAPAGAWFWTQTADSAFAQSEWLGLMCVIMALLQKSPFAGVWALLLGSIAFLASYLAVDDVRALNGLWGITVPLACYGVHAVFMRGSLVGCVVGTLAAFFGALMWLAWHASPLAQVLPPLLVPFIAGVWLAILITRRIRTFAIAQPQFWRLAALIAGARSEQRDVVALVASLHRAGGMSTFVSGAWVDPQMRAAFEHERLQHSADCRHALWKAADRLRDEGNQIRRDESLARHIAALSADGWLHTTLLQDVHLLTRVAPGHELLPLHGDVQRTRCLECNACVEWPPAVVWRHCDVRCASCDGPVVPDTTLLGSALGENAARRLREVCDRSAVVLVLGNEVSEPATLAFLDGVRRAGATVVFMSEGRPTYPRRANDLTVAVPVERCLAWLRLVLPISWIVGRHRIDVIRLHGDGVARHTRREAVE